MHTKIARLEAERTDLLAKAKNGTITAREADRAEALATELENARSMVTKTAEAAALLKAAGMGIADDRARDEHGDLLPSANKALAKSFPAPTPHAPSFAPFTAAVAKAFRESDGTTGGVTKALVPTGSITIDYGNVPVTEPRPSAFIQSILPTVQVESPTGAFLRQSTRTNAAAPITLGSNKPTSVYQFEHATWSVAQIAHLSEPIERAWVNDFAGLTPALAAELGYGLAVAVDNYILNGGTDEQGVTRTGLTNTTGVATTSYQTDPLVTVRKALYELELNGTDANAIILSPADWFAIDLIREDTGSSKFLLPGAPQAATVRQLWGLPVIVSASVTPGTGLVLDTGATAVLVRENPILDWSPYGVYTEGTGETAVTRDLFGTNRLRFRSEGRYGIAIAQPKAIRKVALVDPEA